MKRARGELLEPPRGVVVNRGFALGMLLLVGLSMGLATGQEHPVSVRERSYRFDAKMARPVLESYLSRSITMEGMLNGRGDFDENLRMLKNVGAKYVGRAFCIWGNEGSMLKSLGQAKALASRVRQANPDILLEGCVFEIVTPQVEQIPVPEWAFQALGQQVEQRNFRFADMGYPPGPQRRDWPGGGTVPDISRPETQLWFYFLAASYIDAGVEAIHWGQVEIMNRNDRDLAQWEKVLHLARDYAAKHARRHMLICNGHVPSGGLVREGRLLLDFHAFPLRVMETPEKPEEGILKVGFSDGIYGRSKGGVTYSGWSCDHLPYLVELDNWGVSRKPGEAHQGGNWVWGYDEISWFSHQSKEYRANWLRYAWDWVRKTDVNGFLQMPGSRTARVPADQRRWYFANTPGPSVPSGLDDEPAIKAIWASD